MQVYSGWPQFVRIRSSTTWYVAILGSWVEEAGVSVTEPLDPAGEFPVASEVPQGLPTLGPVQTAS